MTSRSSRPRYAPQNFVHALKRIFAQNFCYTPRGGLTPALYKKAEYVLFLRFLIFSTVLFSGCSSEITYKERSGTELDDYLEEPLTDSAAVYKEALDSSNDFLDLVLSGDVEAAHNKYIDDGLKKVVKVDDIKDLFYPGNDDFVGDVKGYKKSQWVFFLEHRPGGDRLHSVKIVEHEHRMKKYDFVFDVKEGLNRLVGFHATLKKDVSPPGDF